MGIGFATRNIPKFIEPLPGGGRLIDAIEFVVGWSRANSLWPLIYGTACCAMEMMSTGSSRHDWARFGVEVARATPRQADLIILAGTIVEKMGRRLVTLYEQMPGPKYVIAMGACSIAGGPFYYDSYSVVKGGDRLIPVDVYIPGCPPRPEALLYGIMELQKKIRTEGRLNPWRMGRINDTPVRDIFTTTREKWAAQETKKQAELAPIRERFKRQHPDFRPPRPKRPAKKQFPECPRPAGRRTGLANTEILETVTRNFPEAGLFRRQDGDAGTIDETAADHILDFTVPPERYAAFVAFLKNHPQLRMDFLLQLTAVDWQSHFDVLVHLLSVSSGHKIFVRCSVARDQPELESISHIFPGAEWHEREVYDLFGIVFTNHPDMRRFFLEDDFPGHPLRKDFSDPGRVVKRPY